MSFAKKVLPARSSGLDLLPPNHRYHYFEFALDNAFRVEAEDFELVNAWWLAEASLLAYCDEVFIDSHMRSLGFTSFWFKEKSGTDVFVAARESHVFVIFRGTEIKSQTAIIDILTDIEFRMVKSIKPGKVHAGFKKALNLVWPDLFRHLRGLRRDKPARPFFFAGHSLGGALATLAANRWGKARALYTFGCPRVGNDDYLKYFSLDQCFRVVNDRDAITRLPPASPVKIPFLDRYRHVGRLKFIDKNGVLIDNPDFNHGLDSEFLESVNKLFKGSGGLKPDDIGFSIIEGAIDHSPIYYVMHLWNAYMDSLAS